MVNYQLDYKSKKECKSNIILGYNQLILSEKAPIVSLK